MAEGYIKLHRKMLEWEWIGEPFTHHVFVIMLLMASFKESKWRGIDIKPGQIVTTMAELSEKTMLSRQQLRTVIKRLLATGEITIQSTNHFSLITLENWALYQSENNFPTNESTNTSTNEQPTANQQATSNKYKNVENVKNEEIVTVEKAPILPRPKVPRKLTHNYAYTNEFELFWKEYPRKEGKRVAFACWNKRLSQGEFEESMINAARNYAQQQTELKTEAKYIKQPHNFIGDSMVYADYIDGIPESGARPMRARVSKYVDQE